MIAKLEICNILYTYSTIKKFSKTKLLRNLKADPTQSLSTYMIELLPYHKKVIEYFKGHKKTWDFFASSKTKEDQLTEYKTGLLKNTYKFDSTNDPVLYELLNKAKERLGLTDLNVQVYQAQNTDEINASIVCFEKEAHIVFSGQIRQILDEQELLAVLSHELSHVKLYSMQNGDTEIADRIITAIANNYNSEPAYYETARLFKLYTEIFCDRGAYLVMDETTPVITSLIKTSTGLPQVNATSYLKQAEEIFSVDINTKSNTFSHPENFIRARAVRLWDEKKELSEVEISRMIEGLTDIDQLDIFKQKELSVLTKDFLDLFLKPKWFRSALVMSHAAQFFPHFTKTENALLDNAFTERVEASHKSVQDYLSYILLDFALLDSSLEEVPFGWAYQFSEDVALKEAFDTIVKKELKFSDKKLAQHKEKSLSAFQGVKEGEGEQVYDS